MNHTRRWTTPAILLIGLLAPPAAAQNGQGTSDLRPLWREGQASRYRITQTETTLISRDTQPDTASTAIDVDVEVSWHVTDADEDGGGTARMTIEKLSLRMTGPDGTSLAADESRADEGMGPMQEWIRALVDAPLDVEVDSEGMIGRVRGYQAIQNRAGEMSEGLDELYFQELAMDLAVLIGGRAGVRPGATWPHRYTGSHQAAGIDGKVDYDMSYEFKGVELIEGIPVALISRTGRMRHTPELPDTPPEITLDMRMTGGTHNASIMFDLSRHEIVGMFIEQSMDFDTGMTIQGRRMAGSVRESVATRILRIAEE